MTALARAAKAPPQGADFVPNVFYGNNLFGPPARTISRFAGLINIPANGDYGFATSSHEASFLRIGYVPSGPPTPAGAEIAAHVQIGGDYTALNQRMQAIAESLIREGFARDPYNTTEIIDALISGSTVATIRSTCPDGGGDCMLDVKVGNLKK